MAEDSGPSLDSLIGSRARDENGRFVSVTPTEEPKAPVAEPAVAAPVKEEAPPPAKAPEPVVTPVAPVAAPVTQPTENSETAAYKKAMREEREKRQALEAKLRELQAPKEPTVDPWTDLPGALAHQERQFQQQLSQQRLLISEDLAREKYSDFEEVITHFNEAVEANPALATQMVSARNPGEFAYRQGLLHKELGTVNGDPLAYRNKLKTELEASIRAELEAKYGKPTPAVPVSLNSDSSPAIATEVYAGPPPLKSLLLNGNKAARR